MVVLSLIRQSGSCSYARMLQSLEKIKKMIEAGSHYEAQQVSRHVANMGVQSENLSHHHVGWTVEAQVT